MSLLVIFILYYAYFAGLWIHQPESGVVIKSFQSELGKNVSGEILTGLLIHDLHIIKDNINEIEKTPVRHYQIAIDPYNTTQTSMGKNARSTSKEKQSYLTQAPEERTMSVMSQIGKDLKYTSEIGTIGIEQNSLSIGNILLSMKELKNSRNNLGTITGRLQKFGSTISLIAFLEAPGKEVETWEVERPLENQSLEELVPSMVEDLAFRIYYDMSKKDSETVGYPKRYDSFRFLVQGWRAYLSYNVTRNTTDLEEAVRWTNQALDSEPSCMGIYELLSELGIAYREIENDTEAHNIFEKITEENAIFNENPRIEPNMGAKYQKVLLDAYLDSVQYQDYNPEYEKNLINLDSNNPDIYYKLGIMYLNHREYKMAYDNFDRSAQLYDKKLKSLKGDGLSEALFGKFNSLQSEGNALFGMASDLQKSGERTSSNEKFENASNAYLQSVHVFDQVKKPNENDERIFINRGWSL
jgi:tetratricopeptide (TPR) repeat protein